MDGRGTLAQDEAFMKLQEHRNQQGDTLILPIYLPVILTGFQNSGENFVKMMVYF